MTSFRLPLAFSGALVLVVGVLALFAFRGAASEAESPVGRTVTSLATPLQGVHATLYKTPTCGCCGGHAEALERGGMHITTVIMETPELMVRRGEFGVPLGALSCHMTEIEGYAVEGHVPLEAIAKLLAERPDLDGIALPGMPAGSPGMGGVKSHVWDVEGFKDGRRSHFLSF